MKNLLIGIKDSEIERLIKLETNGSLCAPQENNTVFNALSREATRFIIDLMKKHDITSLPLDSGEKLELNFIISKPDFY